MTQIVIVHHSVSDAIATLADAIASGAMAVPGVRVDRYRIAGAEIVEGRFQAEPCLRLVDAADAVLFGAPTYMGGPSAQFKAFIDASSDRWATQRWAGKLAAGFTSGASPNGDQLGTLQALGLFASQHGMLWVTLDIPGGQDPAGRNRLGTQYGLAVQAADERLAAADLATAEHLGRRVATIAGRRQ